MRTRYWVSLATAGWLLSTNASAAVVLQPVTTATSPVYLTNAGDSRLFIVEQAGRIRIFDRSTSTMLSTPFLDITSKVLSGGEQGLLSMAFHPDFATNKFFYVNYTNLSGNTVIERYRVSSNANVADATSGSILLTIAQPFANHNGGQLQIGKDGYLYIGMGDGGSGGDPNCNAQNKSSLLGKMLRLDVRANLNTPPFYGIPSDNPFRGAADPSGQIPDEIWALGLRNPWRFSFDRSNGDLYIGDVGQDTREEIDLHRVTAAGGVNYGWNPMEGTTCFSDFSPGACPAQTPTCNSPQLTGPIYDYPTHDSSRCAVIGGYMYRGTRVPELAGRYVFSDFCASAVRTLRETTPGNWQQDVALPTGDPGMTSFGEDSEGELYALIGNSVYKLSSTTPAPAATWPYQGLLAGALLALGGALAAITNRRGAARA